MKNSSKKLMLISLSFIVMFGFVFFLSACSNSDNTGSIDQDAKTDSEEYLEEAKEEEKTNGPEIFKMDGYQDDIFFLVKGEDKNADDGYNYYYKISNRVAEETLPSVEFGVRIEYEGSDYLDLYSPDIDLPNEKPGFFSYGEVPRLVADKNKDKVIIATTKEDIPSLGLYKLKVYGKNVLPISCEQEEFLQDAYDIFVIDISDHSKLILEDGDFHDFSVTDSTGKLVEDFYNVPSGKYTVSWYEGTYLQEKEISANSIAYQYATFEERFDLNFKSSYDYIIEGTLNGFTAEFSLAEIPSGIYAISGGGVLEIK